MRAGIYIRVSSTEQAEEGYSVGAQTEKLINYCNARDWSVAKTYTDPGFTGANLNRPAMQQMIKDIKKHEIDIVVVYKLDRFTRSQKDCINMLDDVLLPNNCDFISINENFDTSSPYGRAMIGILSVFAQLERETIRERTVMGRIERAKTGLYSGNARLPIGYDYVDGKLIINDYEAMQIREMFDLYISGCSTMQIFRVFNEKGYTTKHGKWTSNAVIRRLLNSKLYCGELKYKGQLYKGQHEPIISEETWKNAETRRRNYHDSTSGNRKSPFTSTHLLTGFLYCGECGGRMHAKKRSARMESEYLCYSFSKTSKKYITDKNCRPTIWKCNELEELVISKVKQLNVTSVNEMKKSISSADNTKTLKDRISDIDKRIEKLMDLYLNGTISKDIIEKKSADLVKEKSMLEDQIDSMSNATKKMTTREVIKTVHMIDEIMQDGDIGDKKAALSLLIDRIEVRSDGVDIKWTFEQ